MRFYLKTKNSVKGKTLVLHSVLKKVGKVIKKMREGEKCFSKTLCCVAAGAATYIVPGTQQRVAR